jgi:glutamate racemase
MHQPHAPIGIFDSGIGGLTVANAISHLLPHEKFIYFGDTAHLPYGDKSPQAIARYSVRIAEFLVAQGCKMVVIACNTASAWAYKQVQEALGQDFLVINVVEPAVQYICTKYATQNPTIGIIATKATINSGIYRDSFKKNNAKIKVNSLSTPLLAPMIEEGYFNNKISQTIINNYLSSHRLVGIETLILACTHYPLILPEVEKYYKNQKIEIVNPAKEVAKAVQKVLLTHNLLNTSGDDAPQHQFFVSDFTESFEASTKIFFKQKVALQHHALWVE